MADDNIPYRHGNISYSARVIDQLSVSFESKEDMIEKPLSENGMIEQAQKAKKLGNFLDRLPVVSLYSSQ